jgi:hypothetical protein
MPELAGAVNETETADFEGGLMRAGCVTQRQRLCIGVGAFAMYE